MAIAVETTATNVKPANANVHIQRFTAGTGGTTAGYIVEQGTDGAVLCDGSSGGVPIGIALQTVAATYPVDVVTYGPVKCATGANEGSNVYPVDGTAGALGETASTLKYSIGFSMSASVVFVRPIYIA